MPIGQGQATRLSLSTNRWCVPRHRVKKMPLMTVGGRFSHSRMSSASHLISPFAMSSSTVNTASSAASFACSHAFSSACPGESISPPTSDFIQVIANSLRMGCANPGGVFRTQSAKPRRVNARPTDRSLTTIGPSSSFGILASRASSRRFKLDCVHRGFPLAPSLNLPVLHGVGCVCSSVHRHRG